MSIQDNYHLRDLGKVYYCLDVSEQNAELLLWPPGTEHLGRALGTPKLHWNILQNLNPLVCQNEQSPYKSWLD